MSFDRVVNFDWSTALIVEDTDAKGINMPHTPRPDSPDDEAPEATAEWFAKARPARDVLAGLVGDDAAAEMLQPRRGRPVAQRPKEHVNIRLDADIIGAFKGSGAGWQTRINNALRDWLQTHPEIRER